MTTAEDLEQEANSYAAELAALPTLAVGYMKKNLNAALKGSLSDVLDGEAIHMIRTFETDDHKNAAQAFLEKRAPVPVSPKTPVPHSCDRPFQRSGSCE